MTHLPLCGGGIWRTQGPRRVNSLLKATQPLYHRGKTRSEKKEEEEEEDEEGQGEEDEEKGSSTLKSTFFSTKVYTGFIQPLSMVHILAFGCHTTFM